MPKYLELKGQRLACNDVMPLGLFFDLAEAMDSDNDMRAVAAMGKTMRALVVKAERPRLEKMLYEDDPEKRISFDELNEALGNLIPLYTERPTTPPSASPPTPGANGGTSRRVSLWQDAKTPTSSKAGPSAGH
jgi:hypothetical protein